MTHLREKGLEERGGRGRRKGEDEIQGNVKDSSL